MHVPATAVLTALCALLLVVVSMYISLLRVRHKVSIGDGGVNPLMRAIRLHGNTAEHVPIYLLLSLVYELSAGTTCLLVSVSAAFLLSRLLFAWGLLTKTFTRRRQLGAMGTYITQLILAVAVLWQFAH
jgi:uncharacterized membrane protein YecN with MAPEG domain